jgi:hypothetical protein
MTASLLEVYDAPFSFEEPWTLPRWADRVRFRDATDGSTPRLPTEVGAYYDRQTLYVLFEGDDDQVVANYRDHDEPLYLEDVLEVYLAPNSLTEYFELEVSPLGTTFDARIVSPNGERSSMHADLDWECTGFWTALRREYLPGGQSRFAAVLAIPFAALGRRTPRQGEAWRANFYRIDRAVAGDQYTAWRPTLRQPADFHVPAAFGELRFRQS